jgi:hypothetical protein
LERNLIDRDTCCDGRGVYEYVTIFGDFIDVFHVLTLVVYVEQVVIIYLCLFSVVSFEFHFREILLKHTLKTFRLGIAGNKDARLTTFRIAFTDVFEYLIGNFTMFIGYIYVGGVLSERFVYILLYGILLNIIYAVEEIYRGLL